jgi:predicted metal-dependent peptidase
MALTAEQRIERAHIDLMKSPQFVAYSGILMIGEARIMDDIPTAMTNGKDVYFGRKFVDGLNDSDLRGVIIHEAKHKMYRHLLTWKHLSDINSVKANMACDFVINAEIIDESEQSNRFITLPKGGLYDPKFKGMDSSQVFYLLPDYIEGAGFLCADGSGNGGIEGLTKGFDHHDWEGAEGLNDAEKADLQKEIDQAIRQGAILAGKVGGNINRSFNDLMSAKVNWKDALREFVSSICQGKDDSTWRKPNRRWLQHDIYMPSTISETTGRIVVAVDTSGSIQGAILDRFLSEVSAIMENVNPEQVDLLYWDSEVAGHEVYGLNDADKMRHSTKPKGGGGTSPSCITKYMRKHKIDPVCAIVLTDGYVGDDWGGAWNCPVLWTIVGNQNANPTIGSAIYMENN